ncbi:MAG: ChaN family lipoprotein [Planctomycetota bacterium]
MHRVGYLALKVCLPLLLLSQAACTNPGGRCAFWIDMYEGEPQTYENILDDLAGVRVVYLGERHTLQHHHDMQTRIVKDLAARGLPLVLGLEQLEVDYQPTVDAYNRGEISFEEMAERTDWAKRWSGYEVYQPIVEAAHAVGAPVLALNAKRETVREVAKKGIDGLDAETRALLPAELNLDDPMYRGKMDRVMMVHAMVTEEMVGRMFAAQVSRDETMAHTLSEFLKSEAGRDRVAVVICGAGHAEHGLGIPSRVRRRIPGIKDRILVMSGSGDVELSPKMQAMVREITITHEQLRDLDKPLADYLYARNLNPKALAD